MILKHPNKMKYNKNENKYQDLKNWYSNVTSLNNKLELLKYELVHNKIDIAFVSETWWIFKKI